MKMTQNHMQKRQPSGLISRLKENFDTASLVVMVITFVLFAVALFVKGFEHDLLLEAGVFLVSVKLIMMGYKNNRTIGKVMDQLTTISNRLERIETQETKRPQADRK